MAKAWLEALYSELTLVKSVMVMRFNDSSEDNGDAMEAATDGMAETKRGLGSSFSELLRNVLFFLIDVDNSE